jgi:plastocyanin
MRKLLGLFLAAMLMLAACGGGDDVDPAADDAAQEQPAEEEAATDFSLETRDFFFSPKALTGEPGQEATITVSNTGEAPHTFTIKDLDVDEELQPGDETEVTVTFPDSGSVEFICRFHAGGGMEGSLTVAE